MKMYIFFFVLVLKVICSGCQGEIKSEKSKCKEAYEEANARLNEYYQNADQEMLDTVLHIVQKNINDCPDYNVKMVNLKIRVLILLKEYDLGYKFIYSLDEKKFEKPYKKDFYLKSLKAMELESQGDSASRNEQYLGIIDDVLRYINLHQSDKEAIADLFFIKAKVEEKSRVLESLDIMRDQGNSGDSMFYEGLKSAILGSEITAPAVRQ
ncbi:hypothetical protein COR50_21770 [Chitinophaga caeni]|uniref:Uncharacterized protein n=1 Tax=Chitinophaga caeni TaxID=2029983 RepID=A0A291R0A0_9BACT|nr:hypothetical protein [Chitinophaga caeni]ATL49591.1 hypothetical protein COR50_21770 [Chitinophaga caeni]